MIQQSIKTGKLFLVPTPIGNLKDITFRSIEVLKNADIILAEDTRKTRILLNHYQINSLLHSHHKYNEHHTTNEVVNKIKAGSNIALVTDAGTPGISDPGFFLIRQCLEEKIDVECLPGPTAFVPALIQSGIPCNSFCFEGFLPVKKGRQSRLKQLSEEERTIIIYESTHRLLKTLTQLIEYFGAERKAAVSRELTKLYEETIRGNLIQILDYYRVHPIKGEIVIVIAGKD